MRTCSPCLRTLPSSRFATPSRSPIVRLSSFVFLKRNDDVRPMILRSGMRASTEISSSDRPSEKYSFDGSPLVLAERQYGNRLEIRRHRDRRRRRCRCGARRPVRASLRHMRDAPEQAAADRQQHRDDEELDAGHALLAALAVVPRAARA